MKTGLPAALTVATVLAGTAACGESTAAPTGAAASAEVRGAVTVLAAVSLTGSFDRIGKDFKAAHPGTTITFSYGGSSGLAQLVVSGAPADVFAAASPATMRTVTDASDAAAAPVTFARNQLVIAVPKGNPKGIVSLAALARPGTKVALCTAQVPCGAAAQQALAAARVALTPVTEEQDVKAALAKLRLGEVDAALVYRTDARAAASDVDGVEFPESARAVNAYPIVALAHAPNAAAAAAFVAYVQSAPAQRVLADAGFQRP
jgi:molybdate transport system substrate-binding protein